MHDTDRRCTKSKSLRLVHSSSQSSTMNRRLGGTQVDWMGERSVTMTSALGNYYTAHLSLGQTFLFSYIISAPAMAFAT